MKQYGFFIGLMVNGILAIEPLRDIEFQLLNLTNDMDSVSTKIGIKPLIEKAIEKIEHLNKNHTILEKTCDNLQQELSDIKKKIGNTLARDNKVITTLQREVKTLKWCMGVFFGLSVLCQVYIYYATIEELP